MSTIFKIIVGSISSSLAFSYRYPPASRHRALTFNRSLAVLQDRMGELAEKGELPEDAQVVYRMWIKVLDTCRNLSADIMNFGFLILNPARLMIDKYLGFMEKMEEDIRSHRKWF